MRGAARRLILYKTEPRAWFGTKHGLRSEQTGAACSRSAASSAAPIAGDMPAHSDDCTLVVSKEETEVILVRSGLSEGLPHTLGQLWPRPLPSAMAQVRAPEHSNHRLAMLWPHVDLLWQSQLQLGQPGRSQPVPVLDCPAAPAAEPMRADSVKRKRKRKMNKHKHRKRLKKNRSQRR